MPRKDNGRGTTGATLVSEVASDGATALGENRSYPIGTGDSLEQFRFRMNHLSERERLVDDLLAALRSCWNPTTVTAWLVSGHEPGLRCASVLGRVERDLVSTPLPESLSRLFPQHIDPDIPLSAGLPPTVARLDERTQGPAREEPLVRALDARLLFTLPGQRMVQAVILLGARGDGQRYEDADLDRLRALAVEMGRRLDDLRETEQLPFPPDLRIKPSLHFIARLEEELARAERFKRTLTVLWVSLDQHPSFEGKDGEAGLPTVLDNLGEWLANTLRVMDSVGRRTDCAFVAVLPETDQAGGELLKGRLASLASHETFGLSKALRAKLKLRFGLATYPEQGVSSRFLLLAAERDATEATNGVLDGSAGSDAGSPAPPGPLSRETNAMPADRSPVATSAVMLEVLELSQRVARSKLTVLLNGETGVGKERLAEYIHYNSDRCDKPRVSLNCGAIPETMIEAEFFGFERGSFTGAIRSTRGKFELADTGTLFLDEIGELSPAMQVKLLRVLDEQRFYRLGASQPCQVDVRVIAITNRDLTQDVATGRFREDLLYRLNVVTIKIPPLRERPEDIPPLVDRLISEFCDRSRVERKKLALEAYDLLYSYPWRGNVRELRNVIERSVVVSHGNYITGEDIIRAVPDLASVRPSLMRPPTKAQVASPRTLAGREREQGVLDLIGRRPDIGLQEILKEVGTSKSTGIRLVNELIARGQVVRRDRGKRSRYRLAEHLDL